MLLCGRWKWDKLFKVYKTTCSLYCMILYNSIWKPIARNVMFWLCTIPFLFSFMEADDIRDFQSKDGRTLTAQIIEANLTEVKIKRERDLKEFIIPIADLSVEDQNYINGWRKQGEFPHPLGWRRLRIQAKNHSELPQFITTTISGRQNFDKGYAELYLPIGAWVSFGYDGPSIRYEGESDWYTEISSKEEVFLSTQLGKEGVLIGGPLSFLSSNDDTMSMDDAKSILPEKRSFSMRGNEVSRLEKEQLRPKSLSVSEVSSRDLKGLPDSLQCLRVQGDGDIQITDIVHLKDLECLTIESEKYKITQLNGLESFPKLKSLSLNGKIEAEDLASIGSVEGLSCLELYETSDPPHPEETYDFIGKLGKLNVLQMRHQSAKKLIINPSVLEHCQDLTVVNISWDSYKKDKGNFLSHLSKLTNVSTGGGRVKPKLIQKLMDSGHFKNVRSLETSSRVVLRNVPYLSELVTDGSPLAKKGLLKSELLAHLKRIELRGATTAVMGEIAKNPSFQNVEKVQTSGYFEMGDISELSALPKLRSMKLGSGKSNELRVLDFGEFKQLEDLSILYLRAPLSIRNAARLKRLSIHNSKVITIESAAARSQLQALELSNVSELENLDGLGRCPDLEVLQIRSCQDLKSLGELLDSKKLQDVAIQNCKHLADKTL